MWHHNQDTQVNQRNTIKSPEIDPYTQGKLISDKDAKATQWRKKSFKQVMLEKLSITMPKNELKPIICTIDKKTQNES